MGSTGTKIVKMNVTELIEMLNKALADEWLAYYQYWVGSKIVKGPMRPDVQKELIEHANDELKHADMLAERIIQLGGQPLLSPDEIKKASACGYAAPSDPHVLKILKQNIQGERCAIAIYHQILEKVKLGNDPITFHMIRKILEDEVEHEEDLESLAEDIALIK
ncbi:ferritin [Candidatus Micrarchaeota archaeon]|nr:ferritin [Candidatus Micrarchaeota archaeon]